MVSCFELTSSGHIWSFPTCLKIFIFEGQPIFGKEPILGHPYIHGKPPPLWSHSHSYQRPLWRPQSESEEKYAAGKSIFSFTKYCCCASRHIIGIVPKILLLFKSICCHAKVVFSLFHNWTNPYCRVVHHRHHQIELIYKCFLFR